MMRFPHNLSHSFPPPLRVLSPTARNSAAIALTSTLMLVGITTLKLAPITNASIPEVLTDGGQQTQATAPARSAQRQEQTQQIRADHFDVERFPITNANEKHWRNILWTTAVVEPQEAFVATALDHILGLMARSNLSDPQMRTVDMALKVGTQLYLSNPSLYGAVGQRFLQAIAQSRDPEWVAVSLSGLAKAGMTTSNLQQLASQVRSRFPLWSSNVHLYTTLREIGEQTAPKTPPPLPDLLNWTIAPNQLQMYVLCQRDRTVLCRAILKDRKGQFVRTSDGQLWSVGLLLRSLHNLGWNFVRGHTPQGIYRIEGSIPQPDDEFFRAYGQFALVNLFVPFEPGAKQFLPGQPGPFRGNLETYQNLLPPSWRSDWGIQQSYWAGKAGRSEFRIHGSGDAPDFFSGKTRNPDSYNWNPTIGCLSALELYNEQGQLIQADMPRILNALESVGGKKFAGYLVVVELPRDASSPIALEEVNALINRSPKTKAAPAKLEPMKAKSGKTQPNLAAQSSPPSKAQIIRPVPAPTIASTPTPANPTLSNPTLSNPIVTQPSKNPSAPAPASSPMQTSSIAPQPSPAANPPSPAFQPVTRPLPVGY